ncbi:MAG: hypothetical protein J7J33_00315, partial [Caldisericia bacterium]|nr:hypothetical protein [Caldisericia bacterium]
YNLNPSINHKDITMKIVKKRDFMLIFSKSTSLPSFIIEMMRMTIITPILKLIPNIIFFLRFFIWYYYNRL